MATAQVLTPGTLLAKHPSMGELSDRLINYLAFAVLTNSSFSSPNYDGPSAASLGGKTSSSCMKPQITERPVVL